MKERILISTHAVIIKGKGVHGPAHILADFLKSKKIDYKLIELPLASGPAEWPKQTKQVFDSAKKYKPTIFIGIDPLNGWVGRNLKRAGVVKKFVYHTPDYSSKRFNFPPANWLYHWIDRSVLKSADYCWTVSKRITELRQKQGRQNVKTVFNGIAFDPNRISPFDKNKRFNLIMVGNLNQTMDLNLLILAIKDLKPIYPKLRLDIIGDGTGRHELEVSTKANELEDSVVFHGHKTLPEVIKLLRQAGIGIALYSGNKQFNYYGDSKKIREYSALGLPVITTPVIVNAEEINSHKAGLVIEPTKEKIKKAILKIIVDPKLYRSMHNQSLKLAQETDLNRVLNDVFHSIGVLK